MSGGDAGRRRVAALALEHVGAVEPGGADADEHLAGAGLGIGVLGDQHLAVANRGSLHQRAMLRDPISDHTGAVDGLPPGPRLPGPLQAMRLVARPLAFLHSCERRFGPAFTVSFAPVGQVVYIADPADVRAVFTGDAATFHTGRRAPRWPTSWDSARCCCSTRTSTCASASSCSRPSTASACGPTRTRWRASPRREVDEIPLGRPVALRPHMQAITLEVILRVVIGTREPERLEPLRRALSRLTGMHPVLMLAASLVRRDLGPGSPWRTFTRIRDEADELLYEEIARRRSRPGGDDMLVDAGRGARRGRQRPR